MEIQMVKNKKVNTNVVTTRYIPKHNPK